MTWLMYVKGQARSILDNKRALNGGRVYPLFICVQHLKRLDAWLLPQNGETLGTLSVGLTNERDHPDLPAVVHDGQAMNLKRTARD
jgi:hypothetical protein